MIEDTFADRTFDFVILQMATIMEDVIPPSEFTGRDPNEEVGKTEAQSILVRRRAYMHGMMQGLAEVLSRALQAAAYHAQLCAVISVEDFSSEEDKRAAFREDYNDAVDSMTAALCDHTMRAIEAAHNSLKEFPIDERFKQSDALDKQIASMFKSFNGNGKKS